MAPVIETRTSRLIPVNHDGHAAVLKIALIDEEIRGGRLMKWWDGNGTARVLASDENAVLLERADGRPSLGEMSRSGADDEAILIMCSVITRLHVRKEQAPAGLPSLTDWFNGLERAARIHGGIFELGMSAARKVMAPGKDNITVLHGDIHHGNVLHFGKRGWLAIDPKGVLGDPYFEYANAFCNPDYEIATSVPRFHRRLELVTRAAGLDGTRLLNWVCAWAALSAVWSIEDDETPDTQRAIAQLAAAQLCDG